MAEQKSQQTELDALLDKETKKTITYEDDKGKKHSKEITLKEPKARVSMQLVDLSNADGNVADLASIADLVMENVILKPRMSFEHLNTTLPERLATKKASFKGKNGKVDLEFKFPDYRTALSIGQMAQSNTGALHNVDAVDALIDNKIVRYNDKPIDWDFFDEDGYGLLLEVTQSAIKYIATVLNYDGFTSIVMSAFQMATKKANRVK